MGRGIIYMAESPSGKRYIGKTERTLAARVADHKKTRGDCPALHRAIVKYGDGVKFVVIAEPPLECLAEFERFYIAELSPEYNMTAGGDGFESGENNPAKRADVRVKLSEKAKERGYIPHTPQARRNMSEAAKRSWQNPAHRENKRAAAKRRWARARQTQGGLYV